jgi:ABC-type branched-subunit amino acid transport system substrate-binding protein
MLLARAIEDINRRGGPRQGQPLRSAIRDYLAGVGTTHPAFDGVTGRIQFDENGDVPDKEIAVGVVRGGTLRSARL